MVEDLAELGRRPGFGALGANAVNLSSKNLLMEARARSSCKLSFNQTMCSFKKKLVKNRKRHPGKLCLVLSC